MSGVVAHEKKLKKTSKTEVPLCDNDPIYFFPNVPIPSSTHPVMQFKFELIPSVEKTRCPYVRTFLYKCVCVEGGGEYAEAKFHRGSLYCRRTNLIRRSLSSNKKIKVFIYQYFKHLKSCTSWSHLIYLKGYVPLFICLTTFFKKENM